MARSSSRSFRCQPLDDLTRQLLFAPPEMRIQQVVRAERLHDEVDPASNYPMDFLHYRITGYRSEKKDTTVLVGEAILPDLRRMIDALSRSVGIPVTPDDPVESPQELAKRLNVSTKTIQRWRDAGLRWRWVATGPGRRKRLGFARGAVEHFLVIHRDRADRAAGFTQIDPAVRNVLIDRARRIARRRKTTPFKLAAHLARRTGRAVETMRQLLEQHDRDHPDNPVFPDRSRPLSSRDRRAIARAIRTGVKVGRLADEYRCTRSMIYRAVRKQHAAALRRLRISYVTSPTFTRDDADEVILGHVLESAASTDEADQTARVDDLPAELQPIYQQPTPEPKTMRSMFVRYNYLKCKADRTIQSLDSHDPRASDIDVARRCIREARALRYQLVAINLPGVLSTARLHMIDQPDTSTNHLLRLLDLGHQVLLAHVDTYDPVREQTFQAYLTWRCQSAFARRQEEDAADSRAQRRLTPESILRRLRPALRSTVQ